MITQQPILVSDLPAPPDLQHAINQTIEVCRVRGRRKRQDVEEHLKLRYHFGGRTVLTVVTAKGLVVYFRDIQNVVDSLPKNERRKARFNVFEPVDMRHYPE